MRFVSAKREWYNTFMSRTSLIKDENYPIILGFAGRAGSGKTSVAEHIVPKGSVNIDKFGMKWDHIFFALPLYDLASSKKNIMGVNQESRRLYAIHETLYDLFGGSPIANVPLYDDLIKMTHQLNDMAIEPEGQKPRTFLQKAGDVCREFDKDCFTKWAIRKSNSIYRSYIKSTINDNDLLEYDPTSSNRMAVIISDVRFENEAQAILSHPNGVLVCFDASEETLNQRIIKRDGRPMTSEQKSHKSEQYIDSIKDIATLVVNSDNMSVEEQAEYTLAQLGIKEEVNA